MDIWLFVFFGLGCGVGTFIFLCFLNKNGE